MAGGVACQFYGRSSEIFAEKKRRVYRIFDHQNSLKTENSAIHFLYLNIYFLCKDYEIQMAYAVEQLLCLKVPQVPLNFPSLRPRYSIQLTLTKNILHRNSMTFNALILG